MSVGLRPAAQSSNTCKARRYPERARRSAASIWACSSSGISSKVVSGIVGLLDIWVLGYIQHIIRAPHCANLMHSDLETPEAPAGLRESPRMAALRRTWQRHYERTACAPASPGAPPEWH